jgi:hypothetical protein
MQLAQPAARDRGDLGMAGPGGPFAQDFKAPIVAGPGLGSLVEIILRRLIQIDQMRNRSANLWRQPGIRIFAASLCRYMVVEPLCGCDRLRQIAAERHLSKTSRPQFLPRLPVIEQIGHTVVFARALLSLRDDVVRQVNLELCHSVTRALP